jgi:acyl carrier protein
VAAQTVTVETVESIAIEYVAANNMVSPDEIRRQLATEDRDIPMDSLVVSEILTALEQRLGVEVSAEVEAAREFYFLRAFARLVVEHGSKVPDLPS